MYNPNRVEDLWDQIFSNTPFPEDLDAAVQTIEELMRGYENHGPEQEKKPKIRRVKAITLYYLNSQVRKPTHAYVGQELPRADQNDGPLSKDRVIQLINRGIRDLRSFHRYQLQIN